MAAPHRRRAPAAAARLPSSRRSLRPWRCGRFSSASWGLHRRDPPIGLRRRALPHGPQYVLGAASTIAQSQVLRDGNVFVPLLFSFFLLCFSFHSSPWRLLLVRFLAFLLLFVVVVVVAAAVVVVLSLASIWAARARLISLDRPKLAGDGRRPRLEIRRELWNGPFFPLPPQSPPAARTSRPSAGRGI